jgi:hypothetical protein
MPPSADSPTMPTQSEMMRQAVGYLQVESETVVLRPRLPCLFLLSVAVDASGSISIAIEAAALTFLALIVNGIRIIPGRRWVSNLSIEVYAKTKSKNERELLGDAEMSMYTQVNCKN